MLRTALLAVALLIPGLLHAEEPPAKPAAPAVAQPCSDYATNFPPCGLPKPARKQAKKLYESSLKLAQKQQYAEALEKLKDARTISPQDAVYAAAQTEVQAKVVAGELRSGDQAMQKGDAPAALSAFRRAAQTDPADEYAQQRLRDSLPIPEALASARLRADMGETRLRPAAGTQSFDFKGNSSDLLQQVARAFGLASVPDQGLTSRPLKVKLDNVTWETASSILSRLCKVLIIPITDQQVLLANDTEENRRDLTRMSLRTFYAVGGSAPQELTELTTALRILFDLRFITPNASAGSIVIRAPQQTMDALSSFLDYLQDDRPTVMLEVKVFQVSSDLTRDIGTSVPTQFSVFNVTSEINKLVTGSAYQQIVAALVAAGQPVNATTILAALLASSSSSSVLGQPFATFGGGLTLTGVTVPGTSAHLSVGNSLARTVDDVLLRAGHGKAAVLKIGERYPIVTSQFGASTAASSLLSSIGINAGAVTAAIPSPQFSYEDLGLTLKATPQVHGTLISLEYELTLRSLGATQVNGLPLITNQEMKGTISTDDGQSVVIAGLLSTGETASLNGIPGLSTLPGLGPVLSDRTKELTYSELLVVMTPHITFGRSQNGSWIPVPMNVPK